MYRSSECPANVLSTNVLLNNYIKIQGYVNCYSPMTFKCTQEFVLVTFHSYSALANRQTLQLAVYKSYKLVKFNNVRL